MIEIANRTWDLALDPRGEVGTVIELHDNAEKDRNEVTRSDPMSRVGR
jgi:hypothetical protein